MKSYDKLSKFKNTENVQNFENMNKNKNKRIRIERLRDIWKYSRMSTKASLKADELTSFMYSFIQ